MPTSEAHLAPIREASDTVAAPHHGLTPMTSLRFAVFRASAHPAASEHKLSILPLAGGTPASELSSRIEAAQPKRRGETAAAASLEPS